MMKPSRQPHSGLGTKLALIALFLAIPSTLDSVLTRYSEYVPWVEVLIELIGWICLTVALVLLVLTFLQVTPALISYFLKPVIKMLGWAHLDQVGAAAEAPRYTHEMQYHSRLLGISPSDLSRASYLPYFVSWFFLRHPEIIPRPELWPLFRRAFLLPERAFQRKEPYGEKITVDRLRWYCRRNIAYAHLLCKVDKMNNLARAQVLSRIEQQIAEEFELVEQ